VRIIVNRSKNEIFNSTDYFRLFLLFDKRLHVVFLANELLKHIVLKRIEIKILNLSRYKYSLLSGKNIRLLLPIGIGIALVPILIVGNDDV
jgi:hypothetical protein